ncbi:MAG TPA: hypothetical protein VGL21_10945 [Jatrophihabitantaceae bacterium]
MGGLFHVTSSRNRGSVDAHGLDWRRMDSAPGIAGSNRPERDGIFVCIDESEVDFFVRINNTGGPVDVWGIDGAGAELTETGTGFCYVPHAIPRHAITLIRRDIPPQSQELPSELPSPGDAYRSELTITRDE